MSEDDNSFQLPLIKQSGLAAPRKSVEKTFEGAHGETAKGTVVPMPTKPGVMPEEKQADRIRGGLADDKPDSDFSSQQLMVGQRTEMEHTSDPSIAREIAKDHLVKHPKYYVPHYQQFERQLDSTKPKEETKKANFVPLPLIHGF